jgi:hypothetical protein
MNERCYCQYAFTKPECQVKEIGAGVDPRFGVELIGEGPIAAVVSRVGLDQFAPERLQGQTAEDIRWLGTIAARHNEIICQAAASAAVLPLRLGTVFRSRDSLQASLRRCGPTVAEFLERLGSRSEWGVKLYLERRRLEPIPAHTGPPSPHYLPGTNPSVGKKLPLAEQQAAAKVSVATSGTAYLTQKKAHLDVRRAERANAYQTIQSVEQRLAERAEHSCRIRTLSSDLTGRAEEMVFNAAYLLPASAQAIWLETIQKVHHDVQSKGLVLEASGPWPPYHFCPPLEL